MHKEVVNELIAFGADPEIEDNNERSPLALVESLRDNLPPNNPTLFARKLQLSSVIKELEDNLCVSHRVEPNQIQRPARALTSLHFASLPPACSLSR